MSLVDRVRAERAAHDKREYPLPADLAVRSNRDTLTFGGGQPDRGGLLATSADVYACVEMRARNLAGLYLQLFRGNRAERDEVTAGVSRDLFDRVNPFWTWRRLLHTHEQSLGLWGKSFWVLEGVHTRKPEIWWVKPTKMRPVVHPTDYVVGFLYTTDWGDQIPLDVDEVFWDRYPNPLDEFDGLAPLAAAQLAAQLGQDGMTSNRNLFRNGLQIGGILGPTEKTSLTDQQVTDLERFLDRRFRGVDKAHKWGVIKFEAKMQEMGVKPKDAEFLGAINLSLRKLAMCYGIPAPLLNDMEHATLANVEAYQRQLWNDTLVPEATRLAGEVTEQLAPRLRDFSFAEFDLSGTPAMSEDADAKAQRAVTLYDGGVATLNEARDVVGLDPVVVGDKFKAVTGQVTNPTASAGGDKLGPDEPRGWRARTVEFGSDEHQALWQRLLARAAEPEHQIAATVLGLFARQQDSVLDRLRDQRTLTLIATREAADAAIDPFDRARWTREFRTALRPLIERAVAAAAVQAIVELDVTGGFDVEDVQAARFVERAAQQFAEQVNDTTWRRLRKTLAEGIQAGESIPNLERRVRDTMDVRRSSSETIARTETTRATNGGTLLGWQQSGVVTHKRWLAALDERTRHTHVDAHGQTVALADDFQVGGGHGPAPGQISSPDENINCRCSLTAVIDPQGQPRGLPTRAGR